MLREIDSRSFSNFPSFSAIVCHFDSRSRTCQTIKYGSNRPGCHTYAHSGTATRPMCVRCWVCRRRSPAPNSPMSSFTSTPELSNRVQTRRLAIAQIVVAGSVVERGVGVIVFGKVADATADVLGQGRNAQQNQREEGEFRFHRQKELSRKGEATAAFRTRRNTQTAFQ